MPLVWGIGFLVTFLIGGLTGPMLASAPLDFHLSDSYFVVAHFHYVLFGGSTFGVFAAVYYWFPKFTGRMLDERLGLGPLHPHVRGLPPDVHGAARARPRRHAAAGADLHGGRRLGRAEPHVHDRRLRARHLHLPVPVERLESYRHGPLAGRNPWDAQTLEWATASPPVPENYDQPLPPIRSERPVWDANHPDAKATALLMATPGDAASRPGAGSTPRSCCTRRCRCSSSPAGSSTACGRARRRGRCCSSSSACFAGIVAGYLAFQDRLERTMAAQRPRRCRAEADDDQFLPHSSIWPFEMGVGMATSARRHRARVGDPRARRPDPRPQHRGVDRPEPPTDLMLSKTAQPERLVPPEGDETHSLRDLGEGAN